MFRMRDQQESLWQSRFLVTPKKAKRLEGSWAQVFRNQALPFIDEERFAPQPAVVRVIQSRQKSGLRGSIRPQPG